MQCYRKWNGWQNNKWLGNNRVNIKLELSPDAQLLAAMDCCTVERGTVRGWVRYHVLFVIKLATREVKIAGLAPERGGASQADGP